MINILLLGFLLGMRHALEADHLAAIASLATRTTTVGEAMRQGAVWGLGHSVTPVLFGSMVIWLDAEMPERLARGLEAAVGLMLIVLGLDVLRRLVRDRVHFHAHRHDGGLRHTHAHAHAHRAERKAGHDPWHHRHEHPRGFPYRALLVGLMHGMAGSAAMILITLETVRSPWTAMLYLLLFGLGSILGMALLSLAITLPLSSAARSLGWLHNGLQAIIGTATLALGALMLLVV